MIGGMTDALLLIALGIGYIVFYLANREEKTLRTAGLLVGVVIIGISGILLLNNLILGAKFCNKMGGMKMMQHKAMMQEESRSGVVK